jgi:hypothetical protein
VKLNIKKHTILNAAIFFLLLRFNTYAQFDTNFIPTFLSKVGNLPWQVEIDSMVSLLEKLGVKTCNVTERTNYYTVGPSVTCTTCDGSLGIGYRWDKNYVPKLDFFSFHFSNCDTCLQFFISLRKIGYIESGNSEPLDVKKVYRDFPTDNSTNIRIELWNECCPGSRIKLYKVISENKKQGPNSNEKQSCRRPKKMGAEAKAAANK